MVIEFHAPVVVTSISPNLIFPQTIHLCWSTQCSAWDEKWTTWAISQKAGEVEISLFYHFILWRDHRLWGNSWQWIVLLWRKGDPCKEKLFLPSSMNLFSYFSPLRNWNLSARLPGSYKGVLINKCLLKLVFYGSLRATTSFFTI